MAGKALISQKEWNKLPPMMRTMHKAVSIASIDKRGLSCPLPPRTAQERFFDFFLNEVERLVVL